MLTLKTKKVISAVALASSLIALPMHAYSFDATLQPVTVVVTFPAGGGVDLTFRHLQKYAQERGIKLIAEYRSGADGLIGLREVAKKPADGFTISVTTAGAMAYQELKDTEKCCVPITGIRTSMGAFVVNPNSEIKSLNDLEKAVQRGDNVRFGYAAPGQRMVLDQFFEFAKPQKTPVVAAYKSGPQVLADVAAGHIEAAQVPMNLAKALIDSGKLRLIATSKGRIAGYGAVPSIEEKYPGWKEFDTFALTAPAGTDPKAVAFWTAFIKEYVENKQVQQDFANDFTVSTFGPQALPVTISGSKARLSNMEK